MMAVDHMNPLTIEGILHLKTETPELSTRKFRKSIEKDLQLAKSKGTIKSFSSQNNSLTFTLSPMSTRFLSYPATRFASSDLFPVHLAEFTRWTGSVSCGEIRIDQTDDQLEVTYSLNFSDLFRWTLFIFVGMLLFVFIVSGWYGDLSSFSLFIVILAFITFGLYFGGNILMTILALRSYLKKRMRQTLN